MRVMIYRSNCGFNGITSWIADLGTGLKPLGIDVSYWFLGGPPERIAWFNTIGPTRVGTVAALLGTLEREHYDVVHLISGDRQSLALTLPRARSRIVATNQLQLTGIWNSGNCLALTAVSPDLAALEQPYTDLAIDVICNAVAVDQFACATGLSGARPIVAWVGRVKDPDQKDFARFTRIAALLRKRGFDIWVVDGSAASPQDFAGEGFVQMEYDRWLTRVTSADMPAIYQAVSASGGVLLMTSRYEGFPLVVLEAAACGAPTIGPDVVGLRNAILPELGAMFPATATDGEAATLVADWIAANPPSLDRCARRAELVAARFSVPPMIDQYVAVYGRQAPVRLPTPAALPNPLPSGATALMGRAPDPKGRHRALWRPIARELTDIGEHRLALRAVARAVRHDPGALVRPHDAKNLLGTVARAIRGSLTGKPATEPPPLLP